MLISCQLSIESQEKSDCLHENILSFNPSILCSCHEMIDQRFGLCTKNKSSIELINFLKKFFT